MIYLLYLLNKKRIEDRKSILINSFKKNRLTKTNGRWILNLVPILILSLFSTSVFSLLQTALPLDMVRGGISRPPISEGWSGTILTIQLFLLVIFQWPIGYWLSKHKQGFGLFISIFCFCIGCLLLGVSAIWSKGILLILMAQIPLALGLAAFLPTSTEAIIKTSPIEKRGMAMAIFSQCFALSALFTPALAGVIIDQQGHVMIIWLGMSMGCLTMLPLTKLVRTGSTLQS